MYDYIWHDYYICSNPNIILDNDNTIIIGITP
jgi:hypothetical protein